MFRHYGKIGTKSGKALSGVRSALLRYSLAVLAVAAGFALRVGLEAWVGAGLPKFITFYPGIMISALLGGVGPGLLATVLTAGIATIWIFSPIGHFKIDSPVDQAAVALFCLMGIFMTGVAELFRRNRAKAAAALHAQELAVSRQRELETKAQLATIVEHSHDAMLMKDLAGIIQAWNPAAERMFGWSAAEIIGQPITRIFLPERCAEESEILARVAGGEHIIQYETVRVTKEGRCVDVSVSISPLQDAEGRIVGAVKIIQDITERKLVDEALRASEERYHSLFDNMMEGFAYCKMLFDDQGEPVDFVYLEVNHSFEGLTGLKNVVGKKVTEVIPGLRETDPELFRIYGRVATSCRPERTEFYVEALKHWFSIAVYSPKKEYFVAVFDVITERKRADGEREKLIAELASTVSELEGFSYSISHDLRAPIRNIIAFSEILKNENWKDLDDEGRSFVSKINMSAKRLDLMVNELLKFIRMGRVELQKSTVDLNSLISTVIDELKSGLGSRSVEWIIGDMPEVPGDPSLLQLLFSNLITNAVKFTAKREHARIEISQTEDEDNHIISVRDNGVGFDMAYYDKLFGLFQRLHSHNEFEGTGIGLANVQRIIQKHGGRVWAESQVGQGATLCISVPKKK